MTSREVEMAIVREVIAGLAAHGWSCYAVSNGDGDTPCADEAAILEEAFAADEAHLRFHGPADPATGRLAYGWIFIVLGNGGWDVVNDHSAAYPVFAEVIDPITDKYEALQGIGP